MSTPNLDSRYAKPADVDSKIAAQATTDAGQYAQLPNSVRNSLTGWYLPEGFGTITYGKNVTNAQAQANAAAVQAAIDAANNGGGIAANTTGGGGILIRDVIEVYSFGNVSALTLYSGVHIRGWGSGGDVYSGTDTNLPYRGSVLRLWGGANQDLIRTANFSALTGTPNPSAYTVPNRFGIYDIALDGNKNANTSGDVLKIYGRSFWLQNVIIQNAAGRGLYTEYGSAAGYDNEAQVLNVRVQDNVGNGWEFKGPHDSVITNAYVARNGGSGFVTSGYVGSLCVTNMHNWGNANYNFDIGSSGQDQSFVNCVSDGVGSLTGIGSRFTTGYVRWLGGSFYGTGSAGETLVQLGDESTAVTLTGLDFYCRMFGIGSGSAALGYATNTTLLYNVFRGAVSNGTNSRTIVASRKAKVSGSQTFPLTTLNVISTSGFPTSGSLYTAAGTISYTGITATSFTGVSGGQSVNQADATWVTQSLTVTTINETYDWRSPDGNTSLNAQVGITSSKLFASNINIDQIGTFNIRARKTNSQTLNASGALTLDASQGNAQTVQLNANCTGSTITNPTTNQELEITWMQDGTGGRTYSWPTNCAFVGAAAPSDTTASRRTSVRFYYDSSASKWYELSRSVAVG